MMHNPPHRGEILREDVIAALGLSGLLPSWLTGTIPTTPPKQKAALRIL